MARVFPLTDVEAYMGHADIATTMLYVHHTPQYDAAAKLTALARGSGSRGYPMGTETTTSECLRALRRRGRGLAERSHEMWLNS